MSKNFDLYRQQAIALGISDASEIRTYIREEQEAELKRLLAECESEKRLTLEAKKVKAEIVEREKQIQAEIAEREKQVQANIEAEK